ncbi:MAG: ABC transporter substrate-binding protein [Salinarimonas sp.]
MRFMQTVGAAALIAAMAAGAHAQELRIGLQDDADVLDTDQSRTFVGRIVYTALCDKLVDIDPDLNIVPQLATDWSWSDDETVLTMNLREGVVFHDGTPFNADAVVANIDRSQNLPESRRKSEVASISAVEAVDEFTVRLTLHAPDATLLAQLSDRAGMMISPTAAEEMGADFGSAPVCSGPFRFVERVQQDRIALERFADYWNADEIHLDAVTFLPIPDTTVRLANLRAGDLDMIERLAATDLGSARGDANLTVKDITALGYQGITMNVGNGPRSEEPFGQDARLRQALSLSIDRNALNQVVFDGAFTPGNQPVPPGTTFYDARFPVPERDVEAARALLAEAGFADGIELTVQVANNPVQTQVMEVVQAMASESGINISIRATEFATLLQQQTAGEYQGSQVGWSGRTDVDGNIHQFVTCEGGINDSGFCDPRVDELLDRARTSNDPQVRKEAYDAAREILNAELPIIYLYHPSWIWAMSANLEGFTAYPDGMIRLEGVRFAD